MVFYLKFTIFSFNTVRNIYEDKAESEEHEAFPPGLMIGVLIYEKILKNKRY